MRPQEQCRIEIVRHKLTTPPPHQKLPTEARRTQTSSRQRDTIITRESSYTPALSERYRQTHAQQSGCLNTLLHKEKEYSDFAEKCFNYLSRKKLSEVDNKPNTFCTMLQNIKKSIKESERRERDEREEPKQEEQSDLMCLRSQIHQIYNSPDQKMELYKMIKSNETRPVRSKSNRDSATIEPGARYLLNPFSNNNTIVCFTMSLNEPQVQKKPLFEAPVVRHTSTSVGKRVLAISKNSSQARAMCFQLSGDSDGQYTRKLKNFLDFLFKINYSNNIYIPFQLAKPDESAPKFRAYIGRGNNSLLVKSLIKRRFWWEIVDHPDSNLNFYWSQNIVDHVHAGQKLSQRAPRGLQRSAKCKQQEEVYDLNRKILPLERCQAVQRFIIKDGYIMPFQVYSPDLISNHLPRNYCIGSKKNLFRSLSHFLQQRNKDPFDYIPRTYHLRGADTPQFKQFAKENQNEPDRVWIVKPGENSNRGNGITLSTFSGIQGKLKKVKHQNGQAMTYIVQSYINRPFLYCGRKFDIRHYLLLTSANGLLKAYWYRDGYIRTSSEPFDLEDLDNPFIHLTNDAIQRRSDDYQKYEPANKLSYSEFQRYLDYAYPAKNLSLERDVLPRMKELATYVVRANCATIDHQRHRNNFQIFGLDFMIDRDFKTWLIEVNYNPCLEVNCPVLQRIIPAMVENSFRVGLDPLFPPNAHFPASRRFSLSDHYLRNLRYQLIFDQESSAAPDYHYGFVQQREQEEQYQDEGKQVQELLP